MGLARMAAIKPVIHPIKNNAPTIIAVFRGCDASAILAIFMVQGFYVHGY